uniref:F-box domain-containing protein n=2 Tax=Caenorhabditis tropicalis TaxID=1561998 RepID=A0A1I7UCH9_9PELO
MSAAFQFPLLKLPWVCLEHFLNTSRAFDVFDLITFSLISKRCYQIVKSLNHRELKAYDIRIKNQCIDIDFVRTETKIIGKWKFNLGEESKTNSFMELYYLHEDDDNWVPARARQLLTDDPESSAVNAFRYIMALFPCPVEQITLDVDEFNHSEQICRSFDINECKLVKLKSENKMSRNEVIRIMSITKIKGTICFDVEIEPGFPYENDFIPRTHCRRGLATRDMMFRLNSHVITLSSCELSKITPDDFFDFVMRWYNSNDTSFEMLVLTWKKRYGEFDLETVTSLNLYEYDETRRGRYIRYNRTWVIDTSIGWDFQRSDGLWATIAKTKPTRSLVFYVWHDRSSRDIVLNGSEEFV